VSEPDAPAAITLSADEPDEPVAVATPEPDAPAAVTLSADEPDEQDDLTAVEGIGPKIASVLQAAGITTFAQLAAADIAHLDEILEAANLRLASPETWPQQAKLAADGDWDALKELQDRLKGGRQE
jgi:predicted flap endonuclease-1-like 5' DNA nuclease